MQIPEWSSVSKSDETIQREREEREYTWAGAPRYVLLMNFWTAAFSAEFFYDWLYFSQRAAKSELRSRDSFRILLGFEQYKEWQN